MSIYGRDKLLLKGVYAGDPDLLSNSKAADSFILCIFSEPFYMPGTVLFIDGGNTIMN